MTLYHNQVRAQVQTTPALPPLIWSASLAATAAAWGAVCLNGHNPNRSIGHPYYVGENIFYSGGPVTAQAAVNLWAAEKSNYTYPSNTCTGVCGHYTQLVWRATREVGCAVGSCPNLTFPNSIVCNYGPAGNSGGLPY